MTTNKQNAKFDVEIEFDTAGLTGTFQAVSDVLNFQPAVLMLRNNSDTEVVLSDNGSDNSYTFAVGERIVIDSRANKTPNASDLAFPVNTQFYVKGSAGTGYFRISYIYAR